MANNVNLGMARVIRAAIMHTAENAPRFQQIGTLQALRSPQLAGLVRAMSAQVANAENRLSIVKGAGGDDDLIARVRLNYKQQYTPSSKSTTRQVLDAGNTPTDPAELDVDYAMHREYNLKFKTVDFIKLEAEAERYLASVRMGANVTARVGNLENLTIVGTEILMSIEGGLLLDANNDTLSALITGIGGNLNLGTVAPANQAVPNIILYDTDGKPRKDLLKFFLALQRAHNFKGKPIVIGGNRLAGFMEESGIYGMADTGLKIDQVYAKLPVEWYYDPAVDVLLGQDQILILDPGSACLQSILEHVYFVKQTQVANTSFGKASLQLNQFYSNTFLLDFDIRVRAYDTAKYPYWVVTPSLHWGVFTRPAGYFKTYAGWDTITGIFRAKLV